MRYYGEINNDYSIVNKKYVDNNLKREYFYGDVDIIPSNVDFFQYSLTTEDDYAVIYGLTEDYTSLSSNDKQKTHIVIPYEIEGKPTVLMGSVFEGQTSLVSVIMPKNLLNLSGGFSATFLGCSNLTEIKLSDVWVCGESEFNGCRKLKKVDFGSTSLNGLPISVFANSGIEEIDIPEGVGYIDDSAFSGSSNLKKIKVPISVNWIGANVFEGCNNFTEIFYSGTKEQWNEIHMPDNSFLSNVTVYYDYIKDNDSLFIRENNVVEMPYGISTTQILSGKNNKIESIPQYKITSQDASDKSLLTLTEATDVSLTVLETDKTYMYHIHVLQPSGEIKYYGGFIEELTMNGNIPTVKIDRTNFTLSSYTGDIYIQINDSTGVFYGTYFEDTSIKGAVALGMETEAFNNALSMGWQTKAFGINSLVGGLLSASEGVGSFAFGYGNRAIGAFSTALGKMCVAYKDYSFAEGNRTTALGERSHAEGQSNVSAVIDLGIHGGMTEEEIFNIWDSNRNSGINTFSIAHGYETHVQGRDCFASDYGAHAGGEYSAARGVTAFVHGYNSIVNGYYSSALGRNHSINGEASFAAGYQIAVTGNYSAGFGAWSNITGDGNASFGWNNNINGSAAYTFGHHLNAGSMQTVIGVFNEASDDAAFIIANGTEDESKNIFEVKRTGDVKVSGNIIVQDEKTVATEEYVDTKTGIPIVTAAISNNAYFNGTCEQITELKKGMLIVFVPVGNSNTNASYLNINGLGDVPIRRKTSLDSPNTYYLYSLIHSGVPYLLMYDGVNWLVTDLTQPHASDLSGEVAISHGGTGATTKEEARENLGAASIDLTNVENETFKNKSEDSGILSLPTYTSADEGKILKIVNGVPTWVALTVAEEVSY